MTEITDQERRAARAWAKNWQGDQDDDTSAAARYILATVDAPAPTLAEELRDMLEARDMEAPTSFSGLLARVEQVEQERNSLEQQRDYWCDSERQAVKDRDHLAAEVERLDAVAEDYARRATAALTERDEARAEVEAIAEDLSGAESEVERLTVEQYQARSKFAEVMNARDSLREDYNHARDEIDRLTADLKVALDKVDRLTAERNRIATGRYVTYSEIDGKPVQKGAESNAESLDPADVPPREPWLIRVGGREALAVRDGDPSWQWSAALLNGEIKDVADEYVTLVTRLVPAPRVITNPVELDALAEGSIIRAKDGEACRKSDGGDWSVDGLDGAVGYGPRQVLPATVLWEPGA